MNWFDFFALVLFGSSVFGRSLRYQAPDECKWFSISKDGEHEVSSVADDQEVALVCNVRTINSEFEKTNFSVIQPQYTVKLKIDCAENLLFKSAIAAGSFQTLTDLRDLSVEFCKIANISEGSFKGLKQLKKLSLRTRNNLASISLQISPNTFSEDVKSLEILDLSRNEIRSIPEFVFCPLANLNFLNLSNNKLQNLDQFKFNEPKCGANLKILDASNNSLDSLTPRTLTSLNLLETLILQDNLITSIADHAFDNLTSLTILNLSRNKLINLPPELFTDTRELKEIHLKNNSMNVLAPGLFADLGKLLILDLSENELTEEWVNSATFSGLLRLVSLNLSNNKLSRLDPYTFKDLYSLQSLRLENNQITSLHENTFNSLYELQVLYFSNNKLKKIESRCFDGLTNIRLLALDNNAISEINSNVLRNSSLLEDLHLNSNELVEIPGAFKNVPNLKTLDLGNNRITDILVDSFPLMNQLVGLRLTENNLTLIRKGVFDQLTELQIINLSNNQIRKIERGSFDVNIKVVAIRIDGNRLTDVEGLFSKLPNLVWLNISENMLEWFDYALIPTGLQWLDIHGNRITELGNHFEIENQLHLGIFDASHNKITEITGSSIPDNVQIMYLGHNQISKIQSYAFFKKPNLTRIDLVHNQLRALTPHSLRISAIPQGRAMPEFFVSSNPFLCDCNMQWLQSYTVEPDRNKPILADLHEVKCDLLYNRQNILVPIKEATPDQFLCKYELECAKRSMCDCCDFEACDCKMICPNNCSCYHSSSSPANVVSCSNAGYSSAIPDKIPMNVTELYLDGNDIKIMPSHAFIGRKLLKILFLNNSNIEQVHNRTFHGLKDLEVLRLENNRISSLSSSEFDGLDRLRELYLYNNRISSINSHLFVTLYSLTTLRLDRNHLTRVSLWKLPASLMTVTFSENPWSCECEFVKKFQEYIKYLAANVADSKAIKCYNGSSRAGNLILSEQTLLHCVNSPAVIETTPLSNFIEGALKGNVSKNQNLEKTDLNQYVPLLVLLISLLFFIGILLLLLCMYKEDFRLWFYSKFGVRLFNPAGDFELDEREKLFDAFVSYSAKDEVFVAEELAPILENGDPPYRLCLQYREFPMGAYVADTIIQASESSRRTILVLSENFIKSEWCSYEFRSAHHQVLRNRKKKLIVIVLGELPQKDLDPDIRLYLKNNTYLHWGDKLFWEKLKFALPDLQDRLQRNPYSKTNMRHRPLPHPYHHQHVITNQSSLQRNPSRNQRTGRSVAIHI